MGVRPRFALAASLTLLTLVHQSHAQGEADDGDAGPAGSDIGSDDPLAGDSTSADTSAEATSAGTASLAASVDAEATAGSQPPDDGEAEAAEDEAASAKESPSEFGSREDAETLAPAIGLELLPPAAYPMPLGAGVEWGSLANTFHGLQWPYMPAEEGSPKVRVGVSGWLWADFAYRTADSEVETTQAEEQYKQQTRAILRVTPVYNFDNDWFVQGQVEFMGTGDMLNQNTYANVDDMWVRFGKWKLFDIQAGRMQGWEIYHYGLGLDLNTFERDGARVGTTTPVGTYGVSDLWDRSVNSGSLAAHVYPVSWARVELQARYGTTGTGNDIGFRPVGILDFDFVKVKVGAEQRVQSDIKINDARTETRGVGGSVQVVLQPWLEFGGGIAQRVTDRYEADGGYNNAGSATTITYGGFLNGRVIDNLVLGVGYHRTSAENLNVDPASGGLPDRNYSTLMFGAIQYTLWDTLLMKYVYSPSAGDFKPRRDTGSISQEYTTTAQSHRLRFALSF